MFKLRTMPAILKQLCLSLYLSIFYALCVLFGTTHALASVTTVDSAKGPQVLANSPRPLVVFDLGVLDTFNALGIEVDGTVNPTYLGEDIIGNPIDVGGVFQPDIETLASLNPALIIIGERSTGFYDALNEVAPTIDLSISQHGGHMLYKNGIKRAQQLARLYNRTDQANKRIQALEHRLAQTKLLSNDIGKGLIILIRGRHLSTMGHSSRLGWLVEELGLDVIDDAPKASATETNAISFEYIASKSPDWILVTDHNAATGKQGFSNAKQLLDNPLIHNTPAAQNKRIIYLNSQKALMPTGGLKAMQKTLDEIHAALSHDN